MTADIDRLVLLASGGAMLLLAGVILAVNPRRALHRALAALVAARGMATLVPRLSTGEAWAWTALEVQPYFALAVAPIALYCMYILTAKDDTKARRAGWTVLGVLAALEGAYAFDPTLFHTLAPGAASIGALQAAGGIQYTGFGPLYLVGSLATLAVALLALRLALHYRREPEGPSANLRLLLSAAFLLSALFDGASRTVALADLLDDSQGFPWAPWGWSLAVLPPLALLPALLTFAVIAAGRRTDPRPQHVLEGRLLALAGLAFASGLLRLFLAPSSDVGGHPLIFVLLGTWRLMMPALVTYALVLHAFRGAESRIQEAFAIALSAMTVFAVGVVAASWVAGVLSDPATLLVGVVAAAAVGAAGRPLLRGMRRVSRFLLPASPPSGTPGVRAPHEAGPFAPVAGLHGRR
jgi:hypothetical protein